MAPTTNPSADSCVTESTCFRNIAIDGLILPIRSYSFLLFVRWEGWSVFRNDAIFSCSKTSTWGRTVTMRLKVSGPVVAIMLLGTFCRPVSHPSAVASTGRTKPD